MKCECCKENEIDFRIRGLCRCCYRKLKESGELDRYPVKKNAKDTIQKLDRKYGMGLWIVLGNEPLQATADRFDLSRERIRQIKNILNNGC